MADLGLHHCNRCVYAPDHVEFESGASISYSYTTCSNLSMTKSLKDLMEWSRSNPMSIT